MALADMIFKSNIAEILEEGVTDLGAEVRPKWADGTPAHTIKRFGIVNKYDLSEEFPAITLRKQNILGAFKECLWIFQKKSNNIKDLGLHIWDSWADENGSIGKSYGYQMGIKHHYADGEYDQIDRLIKDLKENPLSRRMVLNLYNPHDLSEMRMSPCITSVTFDVNPDTKALNAVVNQRSQDMITANSWDVMVYSFLIMMLARATGHVPGTLTHIIVNAHIYDRHIMIARELLKKEPLEPAVVVLDPAVKDFYDFKDSSITINYNAWPSDKIEVAI